MTELSPINRFRKLYYEKNMRIVDISRERDLYQIEFSDGGDTIIIKSSDDEFSSLVSNLVRTTRGAEEHYIDIRDTQVGDNEIFQSNLEKFNISKQDVEKAKKRINTDSSDLPEDLDFRDVLDACLDSDFDDPYLVGVIENYAAALVVLRQRKANLVRVNKESIKNEPALRTNYVARYIKAFDQILENHLFSYPPLEAGRIYREEFHHDMGFLLERLNKKAEFENTELRSYVKSHNSLDEDLAIERLLRSYATRYEILRDVLRDYAYLLKKDDNDPDVELNSTRSVINYLTKKGYSFIDEVLISEFRNGISHESMQISDGYLKIYEKRSKKNDPKWVLSAPEVAVQFNKFIEVFNAIIASYSIKEEEFLFKFISSDEFKYHAAENYTGSTPG
jgi:hypothetical protein